MYVAYKITYESTVRCHGWQRHLSNPPWELQVQVLAEVYWYRLSLRDLDKFWERTEYVGSGSGSESPTRLVDGGSAVSSDKLSEGGYHMSSSSSLDQKVAQGAIL